MWTYICVCRLYAGVTKPERYLADIVCRVQRVHGTAVAEDVRRDALLLERGQSQGGARHVLGEDVFEAVSGERGASGANKELRAGCVASQCEPSTKRPRRRLPKWQNPFPTSFASYVDRRLRLKNNLVEPQADELRYSESGSKGEVQHGAVSNTISQTRIWGVENGLHLFESQIGDELLIGLLRRDGKKSVYLLDARRNAILEKSGKRLEGSEPSVASARRIAARQFKAVEESQHQTHIE